MSFSQWQPVEYGVIVCQGPPRPFLYILVPSASGTTMSKVSPSALSVLKAHISASYRRASPQWTKAEPASTSTPQESLLTVTRQTKPYCPILPESVNRTRRTRTMTDPVARTSSPYIDPNVKGPHSKLLSHGKPSNLRNSASPPQVPVPAYSVADFIVAQ